MAETGKKVEVRYGAFACRVEGFDDPVEPLREVLSMIQRVLAETPGLAEQRPALDEAQFARIGEALADRGMHDVATPGLIVIRGGESIGAPEIPADSGGENPAEDIPVTPPADVQLNTDVQPPADAQPPAAAQPAAGAQPVHRPGRRSIDDPQPADAGPHPSAALYAAPAAAAAEAAFAASVASADQDESDAQGPLGAEEPGERATTAALFAAPAAGIAGAGFPNRFAAAARPADPDDDAADPDPAWADEAAEERAQSGDAEVNAGMPVRGPYAGAEGAGPSATDARATPAGGPADAEPAGPETSGPETSGAAAYAPRRSDPEAADVEPWRGEPERAEPAGADRARAPGGPGEGWSPWQSGPEGATSMDAPRHPPAAGREAGGDASHPTAPHPAAEGSGDTPVFREAVPGYREAEDGPLPAINIFAPPPPDAPAAARMPEPEAPPEIFAAPQPPPAPLRRESPAADNAEIVPDMLAGRAPDNLRARPPDDYEVLDDGAGDWLQGEEEPHAAKPDTEPTESAENRLAALITRYQSGMHGHASREAEPAVPGAPLSAAELAARAEASEVEDLLAVSAAWLTLADGRARFTRREVMEVFETLPGRHLRTLESRIKGFGSLVRSGTLQLVDDGAFVLAPRERARFRALVDQG